MESFFQSVSQVFFLIGYILLFLISIIILRPLRLHRKRKKSTIALKISYILYLGVFLCFTYLLIFGDKVIHEDEILYYSIFNIHFLLFLSAAIAPTIGIVIRKKIKKKRIEYNIMFTLINTFYFIYLLYLCFSRQ